MENSTVALLPGEVRNTIYTQCLIEDWPIRFRIQSEEKSVHLERPTPRLLFGLPSVCRQIRQEVRELYFAINTLRVHVDSYDSGHPYGGDHIFDVFQMWWKRRVPRNYLPNFLNIELCSRTKTRNGGFLITSSRHRNEVLKAFPINSKIVPCGCAPSARSWLALYLGLYNPNDDEDNIIDYDDDSEGESSIEVYDGKECNDDDHRGGEKIDKESDEIQGFDRSESSKNSVIRRND